MALQTSYPATMTKGVAGALATMNNWDAVTKICETAAGIGFGLAVGRGTNDNGAILGAGAAAGFLGISMRDVTLDPSYSDKIPQYKNLSVLQQGVIWVVCGDDVQDGQDVTFVASTGVLSSAGTSGSQFLVANAIWLDTVSSGGLARIRLGGTLTGA